MLRGVWTRALEFLPHQAKKISGGYRIIKNFTWQGDFGCYNISPPSFISFTGHIQIDGVDTDLSFK